MKVTKEPNRLIVEHRKGKVIFEGAYTEKHIECYKEHLYNRYGGRPFKLNLPQIGTKIEKYWDVDYNAWGNGFNLFCANFLKYSIFNKSNKYKITLKKPNAYDIKKHLI